MSIFWFLISALLALGKCNNEAINEFANGNLKFTARLYNEVLKEKPNINFVISPLSIEIILALTRAGAKGSTSDQFSTAINLPSPNVTEEALRTFLPTLKNVGENIQLNSANKLYLQENLKILDSYKDIAISTFNSDIQNINFQLSEKAAQEINKWVESRTNNKIQDLIDPSALDSSTLLVLVNALYFKGAWRNAFDAETKKEKFYLSETETKDVDMMSIEESFNYYESKELNAKFLEIPYANENISMTIILPNKIDGLADVEKRLEDYLAPQPFQYERVKVKLPTFLVESEHNLKGILKKLGLTTVFESGNADLSGITGEKNLFVADVIQKAFINVTTTGTEAAAATYVEILEGSAQFPPVYPHIYNFNVDHSFLYFIKLQRVILFNGRIISI